ncbi:MAG TPA: glycosyltransferase family 2 protein [Xanthobacteraceae bacterium]
MVANGGVVPGSAPEISIVLPAHNEGATVAAMIAALKKILAPVAAAEFIYVDDGSSDDTLAVLRAAAAADRSVRYLSFTRNFGQQAALRAGLRRARGRAVILMDADFEHPPELIPELVAAWRDGAKVVATRRNDEGAALSSTKRLSSRLYYRLLNALADVRIEPGSSDFMLLDRAVVDVVNSFEEEDVFLRGLVRWLGFPIVNLSFSRGRRREGSTKYTLRRMVELAVSGIAAHSVRPLRFAIWLALGFAALGLLLVVYSVISFLFVQRTVAGWSSIMAVLALLGAAQLFVLGIIGEYVGRTLRETRKRPSYIVAETEMDHRRELRPIRRVAAE